MDPKLTFNNHIDCILNKARSTFRFAKRWSKEFNDPYTKIFFVSLGPILEFAHCAWSPFYDVHLKLLESVQKKVLLFVVII